MKYAITRVLCNPLVWVSVIYLLVPIDLVVDAIPVAGTFDDLLFLIITLVAQEYKSLKSTQEERNG